MGQKSWNSLIKKSFAVAVVLVVSMAWDAQAAKRSKLKNHRVAFQGVGSPVSGKTASLSDLKPESWYQIKTPHFNVLFVGRVKWVAKKAANILEKFYKPVTDSIGVKPPRITVILRSRKEQTNGFFTMDPMRFEIFLAPSQDPHFMGGNDWLPFVIVHEYRHAVQHAKLIKSWPNRLYFGVVGEKYTHFFNTLRIPEWLFEGDAVVGELVFSDWGRARNPNFSLILRTNLLEGRKFSYTKNMMGSFKHKTPNHYPLGYYMTTYMRRNYGTDIVARILRRSGLAFVAPFELVFYRETGKMPSQVHSDAMKDLKQRFERQVEGLYISPITKVISPQRKTYTSYYYPQIASDGSILALKAGMGTCEKFVVFKDGKEKSILSTGMIDRSNENFYPFSLVGDTFVWSELVSHPRWLQKEYSVLKSYNLKTKKKKILTYRSRFKVPALSPDGSKIISVETNEDYHHRLVLLDATSGKVLKRFPNPSNLYYFTPKWKEGGNKVIVIQSERGKKSVVEIDIQTNEIKVLIAPRLENISNPLCWKEYLFYDSSYSGIDNIYALNLKTNRSYQVTSRKYGAYSLALSRDKRSILFSDFAKNGHQIVTMPLEPNKWIPIEKVENRNMGYHCPILKQETQLNGSGGLPSISDRERRKEYPVRHYRKGLHLFKITSVSPQWLGNELDIKVNGVNVMETGKIECGYKYLMDAKTHDIHTKISYQGFYPIINFRTNHELMRGADKKWQVANVFRPGLSLPLTFNNGAYSQGSILRMRYIFRKEKLGTIHKLRSIVSCFNLSDQSDKDLLPRFGQRISMLYDKLLASNLHESVFGLPPKHEYSFRFKAYFPGFFKHHSIQLAMEDMKIRHPFRHPNFLVDLWAHYAFPVLYPDWTISSWFYLKRIKSKISTKFSFHSKKNSYPKFQTVDLSLIFDVNFAGIKLLPFELGAQFTYRRDHKLTFSPLFLISLNGESLVDSLPERSVRKPPIL